MLIHVTLDSAREKRDCCVNLSHILEENMANLAACRWFACVLIFSLVGCGSGIEEVRSAVSSDPQDASAEDSTAKRDAVAPPLEETAGDTSSSHVDTRSDLPTSLPDAREDVAESAPLPADVSDGSDVGDESGVDAVDGDADTTPPLIPCPGACSEHGTCDEKTGICVCEKRFDGASCEKCKVGYEMYPICKPVCELLSHTYTEAPPSSFDIVKLESAIKTVPVHCPEHPECIGGFHEVTDFASLTFALGCTSGKFVYKGQRHFNCAGKLLPPVAIEIILQLNGILNWMCPGTSVSYLPTGDISINCEVNPKTLGLPPPYSIKPYVKLMRSTGLWYALEIGLPSPVCIP